VWGPGPSSNVNATVRETIRFLPGCSAGCRRRSRFCAQGI